ncbi:MAG: cytochrome c [Planctomycetes bacterium]|nr:cytochrome c [Planctomycetota bacterium]MCB9909281.1 cytochrome c [Planctomycetota bacterium]HPF13413.1 cytochrome c [Planctomycetota bacterium]HRV81500.1 cytochrome c [Planctomycetota bacterium]
METTKVTDGAQLFASHCALCHGATGDGKGTVILDRPARSFVDGGFSFGNTPEALLRTITNGIGGSPMPGFGGVLDDEQLRAVVDQVLALGPPRDPDVDPKQTLMTVAERGLVVRGGLPPLADGLPAHPRGLLVGGTDGLSMEYASAPLRLLAVRQGLFCDRKDWQSRGGDALEPLGLVIYRFGDGDPISDWKAVTPDGEEIPIEARLLATTVVGGSVQVESEWALPASATRAHVVEWTEALHQGDLVGFRRTLDVNPWPGSESVRMAEDPGELVDGVRVEGARVYRKTDAEGRPWLRLSHAPQSLASGATRLQEDWLFVPGDFDAALKSLTEDPR